MEQPEHPAAMRPATPIDPLQQSIQVWLDSDRVLPADGAALLAALDRLQAALAGADERAVRAGIERFVGQVQTLVAAGSLAAADGQSSIQSARALVVRMPGAGGADGRDGVSPPGAHPRLSIVQPPSHLPGVSQRGDRIPSTEGERNEE